MRRAHGIRISAIGLVTAFLLAACGTQADHEGVTTPPDTAKVQVSLKGTVASPLALQSEMPPACDREPTHVVLRLSYPDGAFYVRKIPIQDLTENNEVVFYAPPGEDVILYAVAIHYDEDAPSYFYLTRFLRNSQYTPPNLLLSGYRAYLGKIEAGKPKSIEIDLSQLQAMDFEVRAEENQDGSFQATSANGYYRIPLRLHVPWVAPGASDFDPQGPQLFAENGALCEDLPSGTGVTPVDCRQWSYLWGVSGWSKPDIAMVMKEDAALSGNESLVWVTPIYNSGLNYGFQESKRFYLPSSTCAPAPKKTYFWVRFP